MQIVIDISEGEYNIAKYGQYGNINVDVVRKAVANGTPLPKGHGKIVDVNDILDRIGLEDNDVNREENAGEIVTLEDFDYIPTIVEADKEKKRCR